MKRITLSALFLSLAALSAQAQPTPAPGCLTLQPCVAVANFQPIATGTLSASTSSSRVALPAANSSTASYNLIVQNTGSVIAYAVLGDVTAVATITSVPIAPGQIVAFAQNANTYLAAITGSSTASLTLTSGLGQSALMNGGFIPTVAGTVTANQGAASASESWLINLNKVAGAALSLGQKIMATSIPVVLPSDQSSIPVAATIATGGNIIGALGTYGRIDASPAVQNASYVSGNDIGGLVAFPLPATASGILQSISIQFVGGATTGITVNCFDNNPTGSTFSDKGTFSIAAADAPRMINKAGIVLSPLVSIGGSRSAATLDNYAKPFNSTNTIWCACASGGTFTPSSTTDMNLSISYYQNAK